MNKFDTTTNFINSRVTGSPVAAGQLIETEGYSSTGGVGGSKWVSTGNVIAASQDPLALNATQLSDASGNEYDLVLEEAGIIDLNVLGGTSASYVNIANAAGLTYSQGLTSDVSNDIKNQETVDTMINTAGISVGDALTTKEFSTGNGGGGTYDAVLASSVTPNGFNIIQGVADPTISFVLRIAEVVDVLQLGADGTDDVTHIEAGFTAANHVLIPKGHTSNVSRGVVLVSNKTLEINGTVKLDDAAVTDSDVFVLGNTADMSNFKLLGNGTIQGPTPTTRRAVGASLEKKTTATTDIFISDGLKFNNLLVGIFLEEVERAIVGSCFYDTMLGTNSGGASQSGACISIAGGDQILIGDINGVDIYKSAMQFTASGPTLQIPSNVSVGNINVEGPDPVSLIPEGLGLRAGTDINISSINVENVDYAALLSAEADHEFYQNVNIGAITGTDTREAGVLIRDIIATPSSNCERVNIGTISLNDCGDEAFRVQAVDEVKVGVLNANNVGTVATAAGISASDAENLQFSQIHINAATGDGINLLRSRSFKADSVILEDVGAAGTGFDGVLVSGNANDADMGYIGHLQVTGGLYDYVTNTQPLGAEFTVGTFTGEEGTLGYFNQSVNYLMGGKSMQGNFPGTGTNLPLGSVRRSYVIVNAFLVSDTAISADAVNYHTFEIRDTGNNILATLDSSATAFGQFVNIPMTISLPFGGGVFTSFRIVHTLTGSPTAIGSFSIQCNYYDRS